MNNRPNSDGLIKVLLLMFKDPLMATLKPYSNGPLYSNTVIGIGTMAVDGWAGTFGTARRGLGGLWHCPVPSSLYQNVTAHPSTASVPTSYYSMWHYNCLISKWLDMTEITTYRYGADTTRFNFFEVYW